MRQPGSSARLRACQRPNVLRQGPEVVLQKQYRPPTDKITVEVPAGLIDAGETAEQCAVRELREETGYVGTAVETSTVMFNGQSSILSVKGAVLTAHRPVDPGFCNTNLRMVHVYVDTKLPENQNPKPQLEEGEFIEVFHVKLAHLWAECKRLEAEGYAIDARVATFAEGIEIAGRFKLF